MGTWGEENFSNDGALAFVEEVVAQLVERIEGCFASETGAHLDQQGETVLMPAVDIIAALCEHCHAVPPPLPHIQRWHTTYLQHYDAQIDTFNPDPEFKVARRQVIEATFRALEQHARLYYANEQQGLILCPYCLSNIAEGARLCPYCGQEFSDTPLIAMTVGQYVRHSHKRCVECGQLLLEMATRCSACRAWQQQQQVPATP
jgi:uncharacterized Zn-finger protein